MTTTDQLRTVLRDLEAKAKEMELDKKLTTFADQADQFLRDAATRAGDYAAENRERVEATLDKAGAKVDHVVNSKETALGWAAQKGHTSTVQALVQAGAAVDHCSYNHRAALVLAVSNGHADTVQALIESGADVNLIAAPSLMASSGHTALACAAIKFASKSPPSSQPPGKTGSSRPPTGTQTTKVRM